MDPEKEAVFARRNGKVIVERCDKLKGFKLTHYEWGHSNVTGESHRKDLESEFFPISKYEGKKIAQETWNDSKFTVYAFIRDEIYVHFSCEDRVLGRGPIVTSTVHCYDSGYHSSGKSVSLTPIYED